ncbi:TIM barrel protein [Methanothermococcus sp. SCGC AD-155-C09]|nr:TIM barrel protein [Methanothermococcus sp. SCGC AD-155-C09]
MLNFGTAGIPINTKPRTTENAFYFLRDISLNAIELEFVRGVNIKEKKAEDLKVHANNIVISAHAPYYINLNAKEEEKIERSITHIINTGKIINVFNRYSDANKNIVFHPGYYLKMNKEQVYKTIASNIERIINYFKDNNINVMLRPETTGKISQFGNLDELLSLSEELGILPCVDFPHLYARSLGKINDYDSFYNLLEKIESVLGKKGIYDMHIHISGIEYGKGGEKNHLPLNESDFNYKSLLKALKDYGVRGTVICESPKLEYDALILKREYNQME